MPKRFSKHGASFCAAHGATSATPAIVAQASSLKNPIPKISDVADCRARPQKKNHRGTETPRRTRFFSRGRDGVYPHPYSELCSGVNPMPTSRQDWQHPVNKRTGGASPPAVIRRLMPPKKERRLMPPHSTRGTLEVSGANQMYEGARVKSWMLGRDVNPAGRGDGSYYAQGGFSIGSVRPSPTTTPVGGWGNSINNDVNFGLVEKEEDEVQGRRIYFTGTAIIIATPSTGDCPNCFSAIKTPKEGCYLYLWKYAAPGECRTQFGCDCGWPKGSAPSGGQTSDGKDVPPCIGGGMNIGGTPIFTPPGGNSCPGCDIPIGPPQARMPGPGIPGAPNAGSMPSNSIGANANYLDFSLNLHNIYGYGIVSLDSPAISIFHTAALYGATGNWSSWSQRYNRCMARCMSYWPRIPFNTQSPAIQGWYDFIMYLTGVALAMLAFGFAGGFAGELAAAVDLQVKQILLNCGIAIHGSSFIKDGNVIGLILGAIGVVSAVLAPIDVSAFVWNSIDWARHRISRAGCAVYCATRASMGKQ